jgi:hypothetical protein
MTEQQECSVRGDCKTAKSTRLFDSTMGDTNASEDDLNDESNEVEQTRRNIHMSLDHAAGGGEHTEEPSPGAWSSKQPSCLLICFYGQHLVRLQGRSYLR